MKLDKNKIYFLGRLTKKEKRELFDFLKYNMVNWKSAKFKDFIKSNCLRCDNGFWVRDNSIPNNHVCAKELFNQPLTLENVQVDCSGLSSEQIDNVFDVYLQNGFEYYKNETTAKNIHAGQCTILIANRNKEVVLVSPQQHEVVEDHIIEYDKFMELFGNKSGWYNDPKTQFLHYFDFENRVLFGFNFDGNWGELIEFTKGKVHNGLIKANQALVFKRLQEHAIKLGFVKGARFKYGNIDIECADPDFKLMENVFYYGKYPIMKDGVWVDVINQESGWYMWEEESKFLMYHNFETNEKWGLTGHGKWIDKGQMNLDNASMDNLIKASDETILNRLREYSVELGFVIGREFLLNDVLITCVEDIVTFKNNHLYYGYFPIMRNGIWAEVLNQNIGVVGQDGVHYVSAPKKQSLYTDIDYEESFKQNSKISSQVTKEETFQTVFNPQPHYDNSKGSLYKVATDRNWNSYIFDVVKRLERGDKKDPLKQEIEKSIDVLKIWLSEL